MPSFDIVSKIDMSEVDNALNGIKRETQQRFDLKGTKAAVDRNGDVLTVTADNDLQLRQVQELLYTYFARRDVDSKALDFKPTERASGDTLRQMVGIKQGIDGDSGRKIIKAITTGITLPKPPNGSTPPRKQARTVTSSKASPCPTLTELKRVSIRMPAIAHIMPENTYMSVRVLLV